MNNLAAKLSRVTVKNDIQADAVGRAVASLTDLSSFLQWFGEPDPHSQINLAADLLGLTPNEFKDQIAHEARRIMFTRSVK